ncbi:conserved hypothetical protein [Aeromonas phage 65]|uniref:Uncharacterized protein n=2 Tax=Ishigurovirus osborne TaxID=260149 RepID=A0A219YCB4_9CAUD|nr:hypothetical protein ST65p246 [Aeromonas phage 65]ADQ53254.1 conserved hypothetical protein [Aeromonas phage 65]APU01629.1 hypothetical protein [Aeromonas phage 65.2]
MKVRFKSPEHKFVFASGSNANQAIAEYMGMEAHTAIQYHSDMIELVNDDTSSISLDNKGKPCGEFGWGIRAYFFDEEIQYLEIVE